MILIFVVRLLNFFSHLFHTTQSAENGKVALEFLQKNKYDLIITDINMPIMDGVTLSKKVKALYPTQSIIITSAHDESSYLLELIDIGIDKFILKPLNMYNLLHILTEVCTHIQNAKLIKKYKKEIELSNIELGKKNEELQSLIKILDNKGIQLNTNNDLIHKDPKKSSKDAINTISDNPPQVKRVLVKGGQDLYTYAEYLLNEDLKKLQILEKDIETIYILFNLQDNITHEAILQFSNTLDLYSNILNHYPIFKNLSTEINKLAQNLKSETQSFIDNAHNIYTFLKSFIYVLKKWHISLFVKGIEDPNIYDISMINDMIAISQILHPDTNKNSAG